MSYTALIVDDEDLTLRTISRGLREEGFDVLTASSGEDGMRIFSEANPELALVEIVLPEMNGLDVLRQMKEANPAALVIMMSAEHDIDRAVEAIEFGAFHYLVKPFQSANLLSTIQRATEILALRVRVNESVESAKRAYNFGRVSTQNVSTSEMLERARKSAESDHTTILIQGESGTGKGVLARAIHYASPRASMPLLELNCATLPDALLESELFGFEAGAFTDARHAKKGLIERAHGGSIFLDEIGNMSPSVQAKVLQVLEDGTFWRLGGTHVIKVNVRMIAATNVNLKEAVRVGQFREDLYYRLNVVPLFIPPLRRRKEDILTLALEMMRQFNRELGRNFIGFTPAAAHLLRQYPWPGNIRELKNAIERSMILSSRRILDADDLPEEIRSTASPVDALMPSMNGVSPHLSNLITLRELEDDYIGQVLTATGNNKSQTAKILGIHPTSLLRHLKKKSV
jgi:two-component system response regulator AtoC